MLSGNVFMSYPLTLRSVGSQSITCRNSQQEGQKCPKRRVAQAVIRLVTAVINLEMEMLTDKKWTNKYMELHQFRKQLSYDGDLSPCQV